MTIILPLWYLTGFYASLILKVIILLINAIRMKSFPLKVIEYPGLVLLIVMDSSLSWISFALTLRSAWIVEKENYLDNKRVKRINLGRG